MHLVDYIIRTYHDAQSSEGQMRSKRQIVSEILPTQAVMYEIKSTRLNSRGKLVG